jgi:hypothetical protein
VAAQPAPLSSTLVRRGQAQPVDPEAAVASAPQQPLQPQHPAAVAEAGAGRGDQMREAARVVTASEVAAPSFSEEDLPPELQFVSDEKPRLTPMNHRVPEDLAEGLRQMSLRTKKPAQVILADWMRDGLDRWHPQWRRVLPRKRG